jgi:hypothetical protein
MQVTHGEGGESGHDQHRVLHRAVRAAAKALYPELTAPKAPAAKPRAAKPAAPRLTLRLAAAEPAAQARPPFPDAARKPEHRLGHRPRLMAFDASPAHLLPPWLRLEKMKLSLRA